MFPSCSSVLHNVGQLGIFFKKKICTRSSGYEKKTPRVVFNIIQCCIYSGVIDDVIITKEIDHAWMMELIIDDGDDGI